MDPSRELLWLWQEVGVLAGSVYHADAARTAASVNASLVAAAMVEEAAAARGATVPRPDVLTYVWLWPGAVPVSSEQLTASVQVPAAMGGDGLFLWGSSDDSHVAGYDAAIEGFLNSTVGPLLTRCEAERARCAAARCSAHGRCSSYAPAHPEAGCAPLAAGAEVHCVCDAGWRGATCDTPAP